MVLFYLTNAALDIGSGVVWWIFKNTTYGIYNGTKYIIYGNDNTKKESENIDNCEILNEIKQLKSELQDLKKV